MPCSLEANFNCLAMEFLGKSLEDHVQMCAKGGPWCYVLAEEDNDTAEWSLVMLQMGLIVEMLYNGWNIISA